MRTKQLGFLVMALGFGAWIGGGCATATGPGVGTGGEGGEGSGLDTGMGGMGSSNSSNNASSSSASSSSASSSSSSSASSSSSSGGQMCGPMEHACAGVCAGNTPATGCFTSTTCTPCPSVGNGTAICNSSGLCDVSCNAGYVKNGFSCVCQSQCCSDAECAAGQTCMGGTCSGGGGMDGGTTCNPFSCVFDCAFQGLECIDPFTCTCG